MGTDVARDVHANRTNHRCPLCFQQMKVWHEGMFDDRYGMPGLYDLVRCVACGLVKTSPSLSEKDLFHVYPTYYPRRDVDLSSLPRQLEDPTTWLGRLKIWLRGAGNQGHYYALPGMKVLDYGCGLGTSLLELRSMGAIGYGIEADESVKRVAEYYGLNVQIGSLEECDFAGTKFDLISLNQVIEHVPEPGPLLRKLREQVHRNSTVILSFPNVGSVYRRLLGRRWINWHVPYHIYHFSRNSFTRLCEREGWIVAKYKTVTPNLWTLLQIRALLAPARMGTPSPFWLPQGSGAANGIRANSLCLDKAGVTVSLVRRVRLLLYWFVLGGIAVVNRLVDFFGVGDSAVFFIRMADRADALS